MSMLIAPTPLFNAEMAVEAYWLRSHNGKKMLGVKDNFHRLDEAFSHPGLQMVETVGLEPLTGGKPLFVSLSRMQLMAGLLERVKIAPEQLVCVIPAECITDSEAVRSVRKLHEAGYEIALDSVPAEPVAPAMEIVTYVLLDYADPQFQAWYNQASRLLRRKKIIIGSIPDMEVFSKLQRGPGAYFTGSFYSSPITKGKARLSPIKVNALRLLNHVNQEDFNLEDIVKPLERDPYLSVSLLKFLNSSASGLSRQVTSIRQAVAILGQKAVRHWAAIALSATLGDDRPNEITKLALVRAKFAEDISLAFDLGVFQSELFMAGLFSLLDVMLEMPMPDAVNEVAVSKLVQSVLVEKQGPLAPVMELVYAYERADWDKVSILMIQNRTDMEHISQAYLDSLVWYRKLLQSIDDASSGQTQN